MNYPSRTICLTEESTETLYLLGEQRRIVGISGFTVCALQNNQLFEIKFCDILQPDSAALTDGLAQISQFIQQWSKFNG